MPQLSFEQIESAIARYSEPDSLKRIETHISWVVLAGDFAYKIKKPVVNPFLDFESLEKRWAACRIELELNRRYAADLYLGLVGWTQQPDGNICLVDLGEVDQSKTRPPAGVQEVAVKMARFPDNALMSRMLEDNQLSEELVVELASDVAHFHSRAKHSRRWGTATSVIQDQQDNIAFLCQSSLVTEECRALTAEVNDWLREITGDASDLIESRREAGFVRSCHGDLHLENIVHWNNKLTPFDGIEFNEHLRWIDTQCDVAFTTMDLRSRGAETLAAVFYNRYLETSGDYQGVQLHRFFEVYRAMVRSKVALIRAEQLNVSRRDQIDGLILDATQHLKLAVRLIENRRKLICITHGLSGSGKTYGSNRYLADHGMVRVRSDVERKRMFSDPGPLVKPPLHKMDPPADLYGKLANDRTYQRLAEVAERCVNAGLPVIVDATFLKRAQRQQFQQLANRLNAEFQILAFEAPQHELERRIISRRQLGQDASDADLSVLRHQLSTIEPLSEAERSFVRYAG